MTAQLRLFHPWTLNPAMNTRWEVRCVDGHGRPLSSPVFVCSATSTGACKAGRAAMRLVGIKRRGTLVAKRYDALNDPVMRGYVVAIDKAKGEQA
ncbi:hypothetical protein [Bordetella sp. BOR01]|uniref:hypothetical protein n=1 Tax=Bordetella sp. BOR01 TaxID=2854779 RepID=UPI001C48F937|nr:hypothetical protein [Bordetella sp. BOR01]MBV7482491.1 hypothetical protein [Bordetella sp. BOR01]